MLMRFDPFREFDRIAQMARQQDDRPLMMPMDAYRDGDRYFVMFDLPGVDMSSIDLTVERNVLTVRAQRRWEWGDNQEVLIAERPQGVFTRQLFLGDTLDTEHVEASYDRGVLRLSIPVSDQAKPRKVEVAQGGNGSQAIPASASSTS